MNVTFTSSYHLSSTVIDSATGKYLFEFSNSWYEPTTMHDAKGRVIGMHRSRFLHSNEITYHGRTMAESEWLIKAHVRSKSWSRSFVAQNGRSYKWVREKRGSEADYELTDCETGQLVARGYRLRRAGLFSTRKAQKLNIDLFPEVLPVMDAVIFSFALCEMMTRKEERAREAGSGSGSNAGMFANASAAAPPAC